MVASLSALAVTTTAHLATVPKKGTLVCLLRVALYALFDIQIGQLSFLQRIEMNYILSKYTFIASKHTPSGQEICLLFSGRTGKNILVSKEVFSLVKNGKFDSLRPKVLNILISEKVLVPSTENELDEINKENKVQLSKSPSDRLYVSIQPTAACQLACDYCGQAHSHKFLTDSLIELIVCHINKKLSLKEMKSLEIGWFGGEPLMAFAKMRKLNKRLKDISISHNMKYMGHITTNGYALSPPIYRILKEDFNVYRIEITLDGSKEFHDKRRITTSGIGSFDIIFNNLTAIIQSPFYDKNTCVISIRCNVDERNIEGVMPLLEMLYKHNMQDKILFYTTPVVSWSNNGAGSMLGHKLLGKLSSKHIDYMINHNFKVTILPKRVAPYQCIGTDDYAEMYDADGNILDCSETSYSEYYKSKGFVLGNVEQKDNIQNKRSCLHAVPQMLIEKRVQPCNNCKFYPLCGGLCPLGLLEKKPRCPSFIYNIEDRMYLDYIAKVKKQKI